MSYRYATIGELRDQARRNRHRDWVIGAGSLVGGYLVGKARSRPGPSRSSSRSSTPTYDEVKRRIHVGTGGLVLTALLASAWPWLLAIALLLVLAGAFRWHRLRSTPVPWDPGYRPEDDPVPHERKWSQRDDDDGIPF